MQNQLRKNAGLRATRSCSSRLSAQGSVQVTLGRDAAKLLLDVEREYLLARLVHRGTPADLAGSTTLADRDLELENLQNTAIHREKLTVARPSASDRRIECRTAFVPGARSAIRAERRAASATF